MSKLVKYTSLFGAILIFIGFVKLHLYYGQFGISIIDHLETGEILTSFLDDIWYFIVLLVIYIVIQYLLFKSFNLIPVESETKVEIATEEKIEVSDVKFEHLLMAGLKTKVVRRIQFWVLTILAFGLNGYFYCEGYQNATLFLITIYVTINWFVSFLFTVMFPKSLDTHDTEHFNASGILFLSLLVSYLVLCLTYRDYYNTIHSPVEVKIEMEDGKTISTNEYNLYLGKTTNYYYFYNTEDNTSSIYPSSRVKQSEIKNN